MMTQQDTIDTDEDKKRLEEVESTMLYGIDLAHFRGKDVVGDLIKRGLLDQSDIDKIETTEDNTEMLKIYHPSAGSVLKVLQEPKRVYDEQQLNKVIDALIGLYHNDNVTYASIEKMEDKYYVTISKELAKYKGLPTSMGSILVENKFFPLWYTFDILVGMIFLMLENTTAIFKSYRDVDAVVIDEVIYLAHKARDMENRKNDNVTRRGYDSKKKEAKQNRKKKNKARK